jgi:hypothetical protein
MQLGARSLAHLNVGLPQLVTLPVAVNVNDKLPSLILTSIFGFHDGAPELTLPRSDRAA